MSDKKKTALMQLLDKLNTVPTPSNGDTRLLLMAVKASIGELLPVEREQIYESFVAGDNRGKGNIPFNCEQYFTQTYEQ